MTQPFDRRSFIAGGLALGAGAAIIGGLEGEAGAVQTNGPGRNGVSTARPVRGGSLTMGIDTEETGFDPSTARWDEGGFLYGRTVFDPLAIVNAAGGVEPYLAHIDDTYRRLDLSTTTTQRAPHDASAPVLVIEAGLAGGRMS